MIPQSQPNKWSCLPTAFAMTFDIPVSELIYYIGHDGREVIQDWKDSPEPYNRRGFHIQEIIKVAYTLGFYIVPHEPRPVCGSPLHLRQFPIPENDSWKDYFESLIKVSMGVMTGDTERGASHAIAWNMGHAIDPGGNALISDSFKIRCFWRVIKSEMA